MDQAARYSTFQNHISRRNQLSKVNGNFGRTYQAWTLQPHSQQTVSWQCPINNSSKCSSCHGPRAFGVPAVLCVKFFQYYMQGWILYLGVRSKLSEREPILHMLFRNFIRWKQVKFFILPGNLLLRENPFHILKCLKSYDFKLFFFYTLKLLWGPYVTLHIIFLKCGSGVINKHFNKAMQKHSVKLSNGGRPHSPSLISNPDYMYRILAVKGADFVAKFAISN